MGLETDHYRKLLQSMAISLEQQGNVKEALKILIKLFKTYSGSKYPAEVVALVKTALVSAIKSPINSFSDRASLLEVRKQ